MNKTEKLEIKIYNRKQSIKNIGFQIKTLAASIRYNKDLILRHKEEIKELEKELEEL